MVEGDVEKARVVFDRAYKDLKSKGLKAEVCADESRLHEMFRLLMDLSLARCTS